MAKKQYTGAKVTVVAVSAAALVYGTAWFSLAPAPQAEAEVSTLAASQPVTTSSDTTTSAASQSTTSTTRAPQAPAPRAKRSRAS